MILDRNTDHYVIHAEAPLSAALQKIAELKGRILFAVDHHNYLHGALTNGDLIRWLVAQEGGTVDLSIPVAKVLNRSFSFATRADPPEYIEKLLEKFLFVPIVDDHNHLVGVARRRSDRDRYVEIEGRRISTDDPTFVIAEIGNNHNGSLERAKRLVKLAKESGADCAKFQMRDLETLYANKGETGDAKENLGSQYTLDLLTKFQLEPAQMFEAFDYARELGLTPLCTPWDRHSVELLEEYGVGAYKVASADLTNLDLIEALIETGKPLILSTGMSRENEIVQTVDYVRRFGSQFALLHCNSTYPPPLRDINLNYIDRLKEIGQTVVGYSGHERDIFVAIAAVSHGARIIEKHFTEDRELEGNDHKVSLLPDEFARMVDGIRQVEEALGNNTTRDLSQGEMMNRVTLAKSLFVTRDLTAGEIVTEDMVEIKSPGQGLQPNRKSELMDRPIRRAMKEGDPFYDSDLEDEVVEARNYSFARPWGLPVRYHDYRALAAATNPDLLEFHLSYRDLDLDIEKFFDEKLALGLVVHSPELFAGDHTLDLCSLDEVYRQRSIDELQGVIELTRKLVKFFKHKGNVGIVTNVGAFTESAPLPRTACDERREILRDSLNQLDTRGVEIWPQTMPPYPWHFGGQRYHNLFVDADDIVTFCKASGMKVCLDLSHSALAMNHRKRSFSEFVEAVAPVTAHLHVADASGLDGEGLQIGDGEIDFHAIARILADRCPDASMIPEIWQGHENNGEGFWRALERMEAAFG